MQRHPPTAHSAPAHRCHSRRWPIQPGTTGRGAVTSLRWLHPHVWLSTRVLSELNQGRSAGPPQPLGGSAAGFGRHMTMTAAPQNFYNTVRSIHGIATYGPMDLWVYPKLSLGGAAVCHVVPPAPAAAPWCEAAGTPWWRPPVARRRGRPHEHSGAQHAPHGLKRSCFRVGPFPHDTRRGEEGGLRLASLRGLRAARLRSTGTADEQRWSRTVRPRANAACVTRSV